VEFDLIVIAEGDGDASLRIFRRGFVQRVFGDHQHLAGRCQSNGRAQSGHASADYEEIRIHGLLQW